MSSNVLSWHRAIERGYQPGLYPFIATLVPEGQVNASLDFKVWARRGPAICLCFTEVESGRKFQLSVYKQAGDGDYIIAGCAINFKTCPASRLYGLFVSRNRNGGPVLSSAALQDEGG